jgi:DNA polymerase-3 subunit epsilon
VDSGLVREGKRYSDIDYQSLRTFHQKQRFIESSPPPRDALQVDSTWQYVNVKGGPDRRFANNRMLPIMLYGRLVITSDSGLYWIIQISRADAAEAIAEAISATPDETATPDPTRTDLTPAGRLAGVTTKVRCCKCEHIQEVPVNASTFECQACHTKIRRKETASVVRPAPVRQTQHQHPRPVVRPAGAPGFIKRSLLTRAVTVNNAADQIFTAIDLETTGLFSQADRIVEIGLVKFRGDGKILDEFATLVNNPGSSPEARSHHQIEDEDLIGAPTIDHVLPEVFAFMAGTVVIAHNLYFEEGFLTSAAQRNGISLPRLTGVCTLQAARRQLDGRAYSLISLYKNATGEWAENIHTALGDARALREVLLWMLRTAPQPLHLTVGAIPAPAPAKALQPCAISCRPMPMTRASVAALLKSFPQSSTPRRGDPAEIDRYHALLDECVEDGRLTFEEAAALSAQARRTRLTGTQLRSLHHDAWQSAFGQDAHGDWTTLDHVRRREMWLLADGLGLPDLTSKIGNIIEGCAEPTPPPHARYLRGVRVGILGRGPDLDPLRARAEDHGASIAVRITKTVVWVATTTPDATDAHHRAARDHGAPMLSPSAAQTRLDNAIRAAELRDFERQRAIDEWDAQRQSREDYWRPIWRPTELDYDPEPLYRN